jgi:hypothetical protein
MIIYQTNDNNDDYIEVNGIRVPRELKFPDGKFVACTIMENQSIYKNDNMAIIFDSSKFEIQILENNNSYKTYIKTNTKIITPEQMLCILFIVSGYLTEDIKKIADPHSKFLTNLNDGNVVISINEAEWIILPEIAAWVFCFPDDDQSLSIYKNEIVQMFSLNGKTDLNPIIPMIKQGDYEGVKEFFDHQYTLIFSNQKVIIDNHSFHHNNQLFVVDLNGSAKDYEMILWSDSTKTAINLYLTLDKDDVVGIMSMYGQDNKLHIPNIPNYVSTEQLIEWIKLYELENQKLIMPIKTEFSIIQLIKQIYAHIILFAIR